MMSGFQSNAFQNNGFQIDAGVVVASHAEERSHPAKGGRVKKVLAYNEALDEARRRGTLRRIGFEEGGSREGFADLEDFFRQSQKSQKKSKKTASQEAAAEAQLAAILSATPTIGDVLDQLRVEGISASALVDSIIQNDAQFRELLRLRAEAEDEEDVIELLLLEH